MLPVECMNFVSAEFLRSIVLIWAFQAHFNLCLTIVQYILAFDNVLCKDILLREMIKNEKTQKNRKTIKNKKIANNDVILCWIHENDCKTFRRNCKHLYREALDLCEQLYIRKTILVGFPNNNRKLLN